MSAAAIAIDAARSTVKRAIAGRSAEDGSALAGRTVASDAGPNGA